MSQMQLQMVGADAARGARTHGHTVGGRFSPTYRSWASMLDRCRNPNSSRWSFYGGRGIRVCDRWMTFENFLADMGERPSGSSIDRIDNAGNYEPANCRWSTHPEQCRNRRSTRLSVEKAAAIRSAHADGAGYGTIAKTYGVARCLVRDIVKGRKWR